MSSELIVHVTDGTFQTEVLKSDLPVLLDFWAPWCGPCLSLAPVLDELAEDYQGRVKVAKLNVNEYTVVAGQFGVSSIPTLMIFKNGQAVSKQVGLVNKSRLASFIDAAL